METLVVHVQVGVLGPTRLRVDGDQRHLTPLTVKLLLRLIAAEGEAVSADQLYRDLWEVPEKDRVEREQRNEVQKRIHELRRAMDPDGKGESSGLLHTERVLAARYPQSAYRLSLGRDQVDYLEFAELVNRAAHAAPATVVALVMRALDVWHGKPLADVAGRRYAEPLARRLTILHETARRELVRAHAELGHPDLALPVAEKLAAELPDDHEAAETLRFLRAQLRARHADDVLRREFPGLRLTLVVRRGDLFEQEDANLAIGFGDTFDTSTEGDVVISRQSVQGQLLERLYDGDRDRLDTELRRALRGVTPLGRETVQDKPKGKRTRYAVGTVVPLPMNGRRVFGFVHCRQGLDLVTHSTAGELRLSLDRLWQSVRRYGMLKPVAIPLAGSGLSRVTELSREQLMIMIIDTFIKNSRDERFTSELRIVIRPADVERIRMSDVARFVETLDNNGKEPDA
jgi:DNA-binding SARP family transcriptional activator